MGKMPEFISLNGPDNVGKTTQLRQLAGRWTGFQMLGAVHEHDPSPWERASEAGDYATWWFEKSTTVELTSTLINGHAKRATARTPGRTGLLDRGLPMLMAVAAATSIVKEGLSAREALWTVREIAAPVPALPETSVLLIASLHRERSYSITSAREGRAWTGIYPRYQKVLHEILLRQAEEGTYDLVVDCEDRTLDEVHTCIIDGLALPLSAPAIAKNGDDR